MKSAAPSSSPTTGEVYPRPALPVAEGNVRVQKLADIYRCSQAFTLLRDAGQPHRQMWRLRI